MKSFGILEILLTLNYVVVSSGSQTPMTRYGAWR